MIINSQVEKIGRTTFPPFAAERAYMVPFKKATGLPQELKHWQPTVDQMLVNVDTDDDIYIMIDCATVSADTLHRRGGAHIDGYWHPALSGHGGNKHSMNAGHGGRGDHSMNFNSWDDVDLSHPESVILASNYAACRGYVGNVNGIIGEGGDCSQVDLSSLEAVDLEAGYVYRGNVGFIHESLPVDKTVNRQLVRLNLKNH